MWGLRSLLAELLPLHGEVGMGTWPSPVLGCHLAAPGAAAGGNDTPPFLPQVPHGDRMTH